MKNDVTPGAEVTISSFTGEIRRVVIAVLGRTVVVTRTEEIDAAKREGREPTSVGFPMEDVLAIHAATQT